MAEAAPVEAAAPAAQEPEKKTGPVRAFFLNC